MAIEAEVRRLYCDGLNDSHRRGPCSIDGCDGLTDARRLCRIHYGRFRRYGNPLAEPDRPWSSLPCPEQFWARVDKGAPGGCWLWTGPLRSDGYARVWVEDHRENTMRGDTIVAAAAARTSCVNGHDLAGDNLWIDGNGNRQCRTCSRATKRRYREKAA